MAKKKEVAGSIQRVIEETARTTRCVFSAPKPVYLVLPILLVSMAFGVIFANLDMYHGLVLGFFY